MTERLFQFIWQFQYYNKGNLKTFAGEDLQIIHPGMLNTSQGPDFLNAKIKCGDTILAGSIELHIRSSEWQQHKHSDDKNYKNCILHVVWENNRDLQLSMPVLELSNRVSNILLEKYQEMMESNQFIPCEKQLHKINGITITSWKHRLAIERLQQKSNRIKSILKQTNAHWEETFWRLLARNFGTKINADAFEKIAESLPLNILAKHKNRLPQLEALLLGRAGLLENDFTDDYPIMLQKEYRFLSAKYQLKPIHIPVHFLRMRPANFPTIRLSQLASLISESSHLFSLIKEADNLKMIISLFNATANDFWHYHYTFSEKSDFKKKNLGRQMTENIILNTVIPVLYAYGWYNNAEAYKEKALRWCEELAAEKNNITRGFESLGIENKHAFDSQALIQLKNMYCNEKRCLQCAIGNKILKNG